MLTVLSRVKITGICYKRQGISYRIDLQAFHGDIRRSPLYEFNVTMPVDDYVDLYNGEMQRLLDIHAPLTTRIRRVKRHDCQWLSAAVRHAKRRCRRLERRFRRSRSSVDGAAFRAARKAARNAIIKSYAIRQRFPGAKWNVVRDVSHRNTRPVFSDSQCQTLASGFSSSSSTRGAGYTSRLPPTLRQPRYWATVSAATLVRH